ncbi:ATP-binding cassette domain-containing protein [Pontixanthobacter aestiaquae]|uniref:ATP-binding cassette domain-containing protein n=1 Tax=Pontixanthobacter aestiaquae TaxID=1509367 RepID=A0A844ZAN3_9SPHN|nr:ATP-binding cassette domain-containing protein [Pontixanthobacter aestiaquae]MDN3644737.1 ATP-binding cassette domain-containing protein [Pontixanthobacter aestiaquae]MXO84256.1 ATP-binding cassette domain-containing protein [Pontixanthobacter aestiaquae]
MSFDIAVRKSLGDCSINVAFQSEAPLVAIIGQSGVGKTTLLNCIAGLLKPDTGRIAVEGTTLFDSKQQIDLPPNQRNCGYVFQDSRLFPHKTVKENLLYGMGRSDGSIALSLGNAVSLLDIGSLLERKPGSLSGGETRRVAIGRALLSNPKFLLLDEPLASLDNARADRIIETIERLRDELAIPMLYVSHDTNEVARLTDTVVTLD